MAKEQVSSILRALQILECFMDRETEWTLKALVDHLDMPSTTVFRQVSTLAVFGAGPCPQELSGGAAADAVGQCDSGSIGPSAGGQAGAGAPERHCA